MIVEKWLLCKNKISKVIIQKQLKRFIIRCMAGGGCCVSSLTKENNTYCRALQHTFCTPKMAGLALMNKIMETLEMMHNNTGKESLPIPPKRGNEKTNHPPDKKWNQLKLSGQHISALPSLFLHPKYQPKIDLPPAQ